MISVIIPVYNAEQYLAHTIACLQAQTYTDFEVLLVNDGSTDHSLQICAEASGTDVRFQVLSQENQGVSAARNNGLAHSKGTYVTFLDADDSIPDNYLEMLYRTLTDSGCAMAVCDVVVIDNGTETTRFTLPTQRLTQQQAMNALLTRQGINSGPYAKLFRKELLDGIAFPALKAYEDILFVAEAMCRCAEVAVTDRTEYRYIQNTGSAMNSFAKMPSGDIVTASDKLMDFIEARTDLNPRCLYITASHLMQYALPLAQREGSEAKAFVTAARTVYARHSRSIRHCAAFPWKEKIVYLLFAHGWLYHDRKIRRV
ncbi:MAG: glycosyltransferase family 2 protein [Clostridia bacterium]|nr:glycosyltransferase family 2 protein [Clostridia bacterium]